VNDKRHLDWYIEPRSSLFDFRIRDVLEFKDLLFLLVKRDFISFYKQTILGPIWFFLQPLFTTLIFTFVFGNLAGISTDGLPQPLFYMAGITAWGYFSECLTKTSSVFKDNASIFGKVYFPRLIMPLSIVISNLIKFSIQFLLFLLMMLYFYLKGADIFPTIYITLVPILIILMAALGLGLGMLISALTTKYRDLAFLITFGVQLLMYATTVIYPLSVAKSRYPQYSGIIEYNPMTTVIETFRYAFLGTGTFSFTSLFYALTITICILFFGIAVFTKVEKNFVDTV
jgi:lipopolysaccharide transport system permease protein